MAGLEKVNRDWAQMQTVAWRQVPVELAEARSSWTGVVTLAMELPVKLF